jgi:serine/threonine protein kinase
MWGHRFPPEHARVAAFFGVRGHHEGMTLELGPGDTYGEFRIRKVLRQFRHAWVYEVDAPGKDVPLALKLSLDPVASEEQARRALREVAVLGTLTNPHVVAVHDSGLGPGEHWYILMDRLQGAPLHRWHHFDIPLPAADAVGFIHQACLGLAEVHAAGIVHRDLTPDRLWIGPDRTLAILDFSSARSWGAEATGDNVTVGTVLAGTPQYAAPEQMFAAELTPAADVYSLGQILYEMLSGRTPFFPDEPWSRVRERLADDPAAWLRAHAQTPPVPLNQHPPCASLPAKLVDLVHRCLEKEPAKRHENAAALANDLGWILHHELGATQAAILRGVSPDGVPGFHLLLPGSHRVGFAEDSDVVLGPEGPSLVAVLEWAGPPKPAELVPVDGVGVFVSGQPAQGRTPLAEDDEILVHRHTLRLTYPPPRT